jgi:hypothetical protein
MVHRRVVRVADDLDGQDGGVRGHALVAAGRGGAGAVLVERERLGRDHTRHPGAVAVVVGGEAVVVVVVPPVGVVDQSVAVVVGVPVGRDVAKGVGGVVPDLAAEARVDKVALPVIDAVDARVHHDDDLALPLDRRVVAPHGVESGEPRHVRGVEQAAVFQRLASDRGGEQAGGGRAPAEIRAERLRCVHRTSVSERIGL